MTGKKILTFIIAIGICLLAGYIGSYYTTPSIATWYAGLHKPDLTPPSWVFAPVWTFLYILMGISLYLTIRSGLKNSGSPIRPDPLYFPAHGKYRLVIFLFWPPLHILWFPCDCPALGGRALHYRPVVPVFSTGSPSSHPVFLLDNLCSVSQLCNSCHESWKPRHLTKTGFS